MEPKLITLQVTLEEGNAIIAALADQPFKIVANLIGKLQSQAQTQLQEPAPPPPQPE